MNLSLGDTRLIIAECRKQGLLRNQTAYVLATAKWETAHTMKPVRETLASSDKQAVSRLEAAWKKGKLPWVSTPYWRDGFFGRGYVQLTHEKNYRKAGDRLGVNLVGNPSLALEPKYAVPILVLGMKEGWFTGKKLADYITLQKSDFRNARRIINGIDRADDIAQLARQFDADLKAEGYGEDPVEEPMVTPVANPTEDVPGNKESLLSLLLNLILKLLRK